MVRIFNPFSAAFDVFATRTRPIVPIPTPSSSSFLPGNQSVNANTKNVNVRVYPLFRGTPPFVARYALVLLSLNIMVTGNLVFECMSGGELYFNPFSKSNNIKSSETREQVTAQSSPSSSSSSEPSSSSSSSSLTPPISSTSSSSSSSSSPSPSPSPSSPSPPSPSHSHSQPQPQPQIPSQTQTQLSEHQDQNQPKPFWRRVSFAAFHLGLGGCIAAFLLSQRARSIRSITIVRSSSSPSRSSSSFSSSLSHQSSSSRSSPPKRTQNRTQTQTHVYLQTSAHPTGYAHAFRIDECALAPTKMSQDMLVVLTRDAGKFLFAPGARGSWVVGVDVGKSRREGEVEEKKVEGEAETLEETKTQENEKPITINKAEAEKQKRKLAKSNVLKLWKELGGKVERLSQ